jgi:SHS2 domain-containing protein
MTYRFLEDVSIADLAYEVQAKSLTELFAQAAEALLKAQIENLPSIRRKEHIEIKLSEPNPEALLHRFLQELLYWKDAKQLLLLPVTLVIQAGTKGYAMTASLSGEALCPDRHRQGVDVKAVTWHKFSLTRIPRGWRATIVLDV